MTAQEGLPPLVDSQILNVPPNPGGSKEEHHGLLVARTSRPSDDSITVRRASQPHGATST
ncbi:hypothetical protein ACRE_028370 [Hapsidospora chrysogenum ATCC 11550]|uniref:Uncharacterized protein n=1 Tax=Hapsidospora chrysogenum (strain ATCC 11550 / CBS 779.69 / DSM 880 / IAM 14645 / JCM 23072 / IMI 49137) TaxID=857340 RepID=A0A086TAK7_HAPC1|nr:hypothetical protein ACRE_028370 [Hapsidospora chrysogenum ATCC 11550]